MLFPMGYYLWKGWRLRRESETIDGFFFNSGQLTDSDVEQSLVSTWMSVGNAIAGVVVVAYFYGVASFWAIMTWVLGFFIIRRHVPAIKKYCQRDATLHGFLGAQYGSVTLKRIASVVTVFACLGVLSLEQEERAGAKPSEGAADGIGVGVLVEELRGESAHPPQLLVAAALLPEVEDDVGCSGEAFENGVGDAG